ncbi:hypothetical protein CMV30_12655 [Nibricoccus aquaticus]|uniref:Glycine transferase n=1 Tax=Nibricoccus aquaticus TaxID=2576891 RepID=A0A290Q8H3_9BACT|nr:WbqC family protein [Nibricoccus aquaticus]ATC64743.1 hypothetical protein CMV30_12655 [Nibricoccus aquaticus]
MKLGIMQPYFAPYLGYFDLIRQCDEWIVFDTAQYIRHGWVNRNRILHPTTSWQYVIVPLQKHARETAIKDVFAASGNDWCERIIGQLQHYRKKAPYFQSITEFLSTTLSGTPGASIADVNVRLMTACCELLGLRLKIRCFSSLNLSLPPITHPGQWALEISSALNATEYINPPGGRDLFDSAAFAAKGIKLTIQEHRSFHYTTPGYDFVPDLSIIDVLMWNSPEEILRHLRAAPAHTSG